MALIESRLVEALHKKADRLHIPLSGTFEVSPICNMDCKMCYVKKSAVQVEREGGLLSTRQWLDLAEEAKKQGTLFLLLTGGEPFFRRDFEELYRKLHEMGFVLSINSNGTLIDEKTVDWLKKMPPSRMNLTLYGTDNETYEKLCNNPYGFSQVERAIELLKEAGICVKLNASITPHNRNDLEQMIRFANDHNTILEIAAYMFPPVRKDKQQIGYNDRLTPRETVDVFQQTMLLQNGADYVKNYYCTMAEKRRKRLTCENKTDRGVQCRAGSSTFWITWDGKMLPCGMMIEPEAYPLQDGFSEAWESLKTKVSAIKLPQECSVCADFELCHTCAAMIYSETGRFDEKPEYRCQMVKEYENSCADCLGISVEELKCLGKK